MISRRVFTSHVAALCTGGVLVIALGAAQQMESGQAPDPAEMQAAMENYMKSIQPGEKHKFLEQFVGEWDVTMRMYWDPSGPPIESKGELSSKLIHGGRFVQQEMKCMMKFPGADGQMMDVPTTGLGLLGYDNNRKLYTTVWTDSASTGVITARGSLSRDGKVMTMFGEMDEPMTGEMGKSVKYVTRIIGPEKYVFEIYEVLYGDPFKVVEIEHTKKK